MDLITGATGHVGKVLVKELVQKGGKLRLLVRKGSNLKGIDSNKCEIVYGDITNLESLIRVTKGIDKVFHLASKITIMPGNEEKVYGINVGGTQNIIKACQENNVKKMLYVSSIHAITEPKHGIVIDESYPFNPESSRGVYDRSKALASLAVIDAVESGKLNATIVCPTGIIGPNDSKPSLFGSNMINHVKNGTPLYVKGTYDYVDVRDVVSGIISAMENGENGEHYILSGEQLTLKEFYACLEEFSGRTAPKNTMPYWLALAVANVLVKIQRKPVFTPYSLKTLISNSQISHAKATKKLGYKPRSVKEALKAQYEWFLENGYFNK